MRISGTEGRIEFFGRKTQTPVWSPQATFFISSLLQFFRLPPSRRRRLCGWAFAFGSAVND
jgi:hypothetical protein